MIRFPTFKFCKWIFSWQKDDDVETKDFPEKIHSSTELHICKALLATYLISHGRGDARLHRTQDGRLGSLVGGFPHPFETCYIINLDHFLQFLGVDFFKKNSWKLKTSGNVAQFISLHPFPCFKWPESCESYKVASLAIKEPRRWYPWFWLHTTIALCCSLTWNITTSNSNRAPIHILGGSSQLVNT